MYSYMVIKKAHSLQLIEGYKCKGRSVAVWGVMRARNWE